MKPALFLFLAALIACNALPEGQSQTPDDELYREARQRAEQFDQAAAAARRCLHAWLEEADPRTLLLPDRLPGGRGARGAERVYRPHNSGADLYPYLVLTAHLTDPELFRGRMLEMLRNEIRYTTVQRSLPGELDLSTGKLGAASLFGAAEYTKDGLVSVTELLGRTPWFERMVDLTVDLMAAAPVQTEFGLLPGADAEINGDVLQTLVRLIPMLRDERFLEWARRIGDAYINEIIPANQGLPCSRWDFAAKKGDGQLRLRDHGNEIIVGLTLLFALEEEMGSERGRRYEPVLRRMFERILESANPDGLLFNVIDTATLEPVDRGLSDNWGYVYGAAYTFYQCTGETKYRDAARKVLANLPKYRKHNWESGSFDGYADSLEGALYLVNREAVPEALDWIESEVQVMLSMQKPNGHLENWYGEGNFNRTLLLYLLMKSQGARPERWVPGLGLGAVLREGTLYLHVGSTGSGAAAVVRFDTPRHRQIFRYKHNYARLNEFPEWFVVNETELYGVGRRGESEPRVYLGAELSRGVELAAGDWRINRFGPAPYAKR